MPGCIASRSAQDHIIGDLGHIEVRKSDADIDNVVIGATHGLSEPDAAALATVLSDETGAGLVIAYGFRNKRIPVAQPLVYTSPLIVRAGDPRQTGSVYSEFRTHLQNAADGPLKFYIGVRSADQSLTLNRIEVATAGLSVEQVKVLKAAFVRIRDQALQAGEAPKIDMALNPLDDISWNITGVKNHGVLLLAEKGLIFRMPKILGAAQAKPVYTEILKEWAAHTLATVMENSSEVPEIDVKLMPYGRMEWIRSRKNIPSVVIGAPHGSFDRHTAELVQDLSYRTSFAAVIAKGFTPTECGGWRINVNRPTEKNYPSRGPEEERGTDRAVRTYERFRETVLRAAAGPLDLYIDIHQNSHDNNLDVATLGISRAEAEAIKKAYVEIRQQILRAYDNLPKVNLAIEPIDKVTFRARVAKEQGILRLAKRSLHFELPAHRVLYNPHARRVYTAILAKLVDRIAAMPAGPMVGRTEE
ncbi:MAG: hypothetical protein ACREP3_13740 [Candidatus Binatia bacterium]